MIVRQGEAQRLLSSGGTYGGILLSLFATGAANDYSILPADFNKAVVQIEVYLKRNGVMTVMNNNWLLLGTLKTRRANYDRFFNGIDYVYDTAGAKNQMAFLSYLPWHCPITLRNGDSLEVIVTWNQGGASANIDTNASYIDFILSPSNGIEWGVPQTKFDVVQTNAQSGDYVNSNGVYKIDLLNFDQPNLATIVTTQASLSADRLKYSATQLELFAAEQWKYPNNIPYRFTTDGTVSPNNSVVRGQDYLPQSYTIFESFRGEGLNNCILSANFNAANVAAAQNWVGYDMVIVDERNKQNAINRAAARAKYDIGNIVNARG